MIEQENAIKIAVLQEQIAGLREQQKAHAEATNIQLNRVTSRLDTMAQKQDELIAIMNRGRGAFAVSMVVAGIIGGAIVKAVSTALTFVR